MEYRLTVNSKSMDYKTISDDLSNFLCGSLDPLFKEEAIIISVTAFEYVYEDVLKEICKLYKDHTIIIDATNYVGSGNREKDYDHCTYYEEDPAIADYNALVYKFLGLIEKIGFYRLTDLICECMTDGYVWSDLHDYYIYLGDTNIKYIKSLICIVNHLFELGIEGEEE